ncbi:MAG: hypothetical protein K6T17_02270 [Fimbriimonadales bacterium]|nr:hypothetical protein [Fimbriimonadales bacterium]
MTKLNPWTYVVCALVLIAITWAGFWFFSIGKLRQEIAEYQKQNAALDEILSPASQKRAQERLTEAYRRVYEAEQQWKVIAEKHTPPSSRINLSPNRWQLTVMARRWHGQVERDLRNWITRSGVRIIAPVEGGQTGPFVPYPTDLPNELVELYFNYPALQFPVAIWDLGEITVEGTYEQVVRHVRSWNDIPGYIASVRGLAIEGTGNRVRGKYGLVVIAYINTPDVFGGPTEGGKIPDISPAGTGGGRSGTMERPGRAGAPGGAPGGTTVPGGGAAAGAA